ncbi:MAG TPA: hypothetical protein VEA99_18245 [Gemmatimonadaceae bacterium]|nr:hypothetical protein [Gemmatimonadaceae bacterium]
MPVDQSSQRRPLGMPHREFVDSLGHHWDVWDVNPSQLSFQGSSPAGGNEANAAGARSRTRLPQQFAAGWLAFEREGEKRRLTPIPPGWSLLDDDALEALCQRGSIVQPRRGPRLARDASDDAMGKGM